MMKKKLGYHSETIIVPKHMDIQAEEQAYGQRDRLLQYTRKLMNISMG